mgnify:CR=1 FL=1
MPMCLISPIQKMIEDPLTWDDCYAIALALINEHGDMDIKAVTLEMIYNWTLGLSAFRDDPDLINDAILMAIYCEWFEEVNPV